MAFLIVGCAPAPTANSGNPVRAVYLVQGDGQLSSEDLQSHPEVIVTNSFDDFKKLVAQSKASLWIDITVARSVDIQWLDKKPQKFYPIALIGSSDALCSFRDILDVHSISGPYTDCSAPPKGFSVWMLRSDNSQGTSAFMKGYEQALTVQSILDITNALLDGEIK